MRALTVYVPQSGKTNFAVGLSNGIWGFQKPQDRYEALQPGDLILLGEAASAGPRIQPEDWVSARLGVLEIGRLTTGIYHDTQPVWPDEIPGGVSYPYRVEFEHLGTLENVPVGPAGPLDQNLAEGIRLSGTRQGSGSVGELSEAVEDAILAALGATSSPRIRATIVTPRTDPVPSISPATLLDAFRRELDRAGLEFPEHVPTRFLCGLLSKPFVILAGLSGSGKTQIASAFGRWIGNERTHTAAVRPDWTGSEALFGYENLLLPPSPDGRAAWTVPPVLEFLLGALDEPDEPHLLILDEMNLAHVERYFADALSGMESAAPVLPNLTLEKGTWRPKPGEPATLPWPRNLFVVGTVNMDETTYQFSPKVLDRSTTIEFRTDTDSLVATPPEPERIEPADPQQRQALLAVLGDDFGPVPDTLEKQIRHLHRDLAAHGREFGHRTYQEMLRYSAIASTAAGLDETTLLDHLVLQKILPRLHGSSRELTAVMDALGRHVAGRSAGDEENATAAAALPLSAEKLGRMRSELEATHFTSF